MALSSGTRSLLGELASWTVAAAILLAAFVHYDTLRELTADAMGLGTAPAGADTAAPDAGETVPAARSGTEELRAGADGHYYAMAEVNGRGLDVMVDTGASIVALTYEDAERSVCASARPTLPARSRPPTAAPPSHPSPSTG